MAYDYNKLYGSTPHALGKPTQIFVDFFEQYTAGALRVLDIGCGQGRDAVFIARMGHSVVAVDLSPNGISELNAATNKENLAVEGVVADISTFDPSGEFDVILFDRTLHMLPEKERLKALTRLIGVVPVGGWVLIADEVSNMQGFKDVFEANEQAWATELDAGGSLFLQRS